MQDLDYFYGGSFKNGWLTVEVLSAIIISPNELFWFLVLTFLKTALTDFNAALTYFAWSLVDWIHSQALESSMYMLFIPFSVARFASYSYWWRCFGSVYSQSAPNPCRFSSIS